MSEKGIKKLDKARKILEKGNEFLEDENYNKAIKNYVKAWDQIKKSLKDPHFKKMKIVDYEGVDFLDNTFDDIPDANLMDCADSGSDTICSARLKTDPDKSITYSFNCADEAQLDNERFENQLGFETTYQVSP